MVSRVAPVLAFFAVIFTLGTRAPDASLTTPESVAVGVCPNATTLASSAVRAASNKPFLLIINRCSFRVGLGPYAICYMPYFIRHMAYEIWHMSVQVSSAVTKNHLPGDQLGVVAGQKRDQRGQVLRLAPLLDGLVLHDAVEGLLVGMGRRAFGGDHSGGDGVDRDVVIAEFLGQHARETHHRALRRDVGHLPRVGQKVSPRSHVDDPSALALFEQRIDSFRDEEITDVVDLDEAVDLVVSKLMPGRSARQYARVVDQNVHATVM